MTHIDTQLIEVCLRHGAAITGLSHDGQKVHGGRLLLTIAGLESSFGEKRLFVKMEPGYAPGGHYYEASKEVRQMWKVYGCLAASSFGTFQIMQATARELGYTGHPIDLQKDEICAFWATKLITNRIIKAKGAKTLVQVLDAYNTGSYGDRNFPVQYVEHGQQIYHDLQNV